PYRPLPQPPMVPPQDFYRDETRPNQYVQPGAKQRLGGNYGPSVSPTQENVGQNPVQSGRSGGPGLGFDKMQLRQLSSLDTPPLNPSGSRGCRSGTILALTLVLLLVFGVGLFSGWVFAHSGILGANSPGANSPLQTNSNSKVTVPAGNSSNL